MITPLKLGIAVACLVGVAILIAVDLGSSRKHEDLPPAAVAPVNPPPPPPPPVLPSTPTAAVRPAPVICPQPPSPEEPVARTEAPRKAEPAKAPEPAPAVEKKAPKESTEAPSEEPRNYTVVPGDTLYGISVKVFGTPRYYEKIYELNRDRIRDPNTLQVGINLKLPDAPRPSTVTNVGQPAARD